MERIEDDDLTAQNSRHHDVASERGAERAAIMYTLIQTAKLNDIDPQAWLADTLSKIADTPQTRLGKLLPWNWMSDHRSRAAA